MNYYILVMKLTFIFVLLLLFFGKNSIVSSSDNDSFHKLSHKTFTHYSKKEINASDCHSSHNSEVDLDRCDGFCLCSYSSHTLYSFVNTNDKNFNFIPKLNHSIYCTSFSINSIVNQPPEKPPRFT